MRPKEYLELLNTQGEESGALALSELTADDKDLLAQIFDRLLGSRDSPDFRRRVITAALRAAANKVGLFSLPARCI